uniref:Uncharacterized protein n=1 Tax=Arundo donax TaxID=35708 RepID=A0A0A9BZB8_ARUDO
MATAGDGGLSMYTRTGWDGPGQSPGQVRAGLDAAGSGDHGSAFADARGA